MKATTTNAPPAPTHIITGPARRFWLDQDGGELTGKTVTIRRQFPSHETAHIACRLTDGCWCYVPAKNLRSLTP